MVAASNKRDHDNKNDQHSEEASDRYPRNGISRERRRCWDGSAVCVESAGQYRVAFVTAHA